MTYTGPKVQPGIGGQILTNVPAQWNAQWFREWALNYLQYADVRNANAGAGIKITGNLTSPPATIAVSDDVAALFKQPYVLAATPSEISSDFDDYRLLTAQPGVLTVTDGGAEADITVGVAANGIGNTQLRQGAALSIVGNATNAIADVADIVGSTANTVLLSTGSALQFAALPLAALATQANDTILGNISGGAAAPTALTQAQLTALVNLATASLTGAMPALDSNTAHFLNGAGAWATPAYATGANPSASVGLAAVNGSATTFMRSDGAPALSVAIAPTWTGAHTFTPSSSSAVAVTINGTASGVAGLQINAGVNQWGQVITGSSTSGESYGLEIAAGTTSADNPIYVTNQGGSAVFFEIFGDGHGTLGVSSSSGLQWTSTGAMTSSVGTTLTTAALIGSTTAHTVGFYGTTPVAQRTTTTQQHTSLLNTTATTYASSQANNTAIALQEVMNTLFAYGLWGTH